MQSICSFTNWLPFCHSRPLSRWPLRDNSCGWEQPEKTLSNSKLKTISKACCFQQSTKLPRSCFFTSRIILRRFNCMGKFWFDFVDCGLYNWDPRDGLLTMWLGYIKYQKKRRAVPIPKKERKRKRALGRCQRNCIFTKNIFHKETLHSHEAKSGLILTIYVLYIMYLFRNCKPLWAGAPA